MKSKTLFLVLTTRWFNMHQRGGKDIEYRAKTDYWLRRLFDDQGEPKQFDTVTFQLGYGKNAPRLIKEFKGLSVGQPVRGWAPIESLGTEFYQIHCGRLLYQPIE